MGFWNPRIFPSTASAKQRGSSRGEERGGSRRSQGRSLFGIARRALTHVNPLNQASPLTAGEPAERDRQVTSSAAVWVAYPAASPAISFSNKSGHDGLLFYSPMASSGSRKTTPTKPSLLRSKGHSTRLAFKCGMEGPLV